MGKNKSKGSFYLLFFLYLKDGHLFASHNEYSGKSIILLNFVAEYVPSKLANLAERNCWTPPYPTPYLSVQMALLLR